MPGANTLAYNKYFLNTATKSFITLYLSVSVIKLSIFDTNVMKIQKIS
jgi:hypothetical protein